MEATQSFDDLVKIVQILRKECPWDRKQTHDSIKDNLIEEAYEAVEAIDKRNFDEFKKELGDLLLHVVFHSNMASEKDEFSIRDVIQTIQEKLIRRHPHVFGETEAADDREVAENWESIKLKEGKDSILDGIPERLPALIKAQRMQEKASNIGFDWKRSPGGREEVWKKINEELKEFKLSIENSDEEERKEEFGDLLFTLVNLGRFFDVNAEDCLRLTNRKFEKRFRYVEEKVAESGSTINKASLEEMDTYWNEAKSDS